MIIEGVFFWGVFSACVFGEFVSTKTGEELFVFPLHNLRAQEFKQDVQSSARVEP